MYLQGVNEIEERFKKAIELLRTGKMNTRTLAEELGVSRSTAHRIINELKRRRYAFHAVRDSQGWRYELPVVGGQTLLRRGILNKT